MLAQSVNHVTLDREELTERFNELNEKLSELKAKHKRLYKAFPSLKNGRKKLKKVISKKK